MKTLLVKFSIYTIEFTSVFLIGVLWKRNINPILSSFNMADSDIGKFLIFILALLTITYAIVNFNSYLDRKYFRK